MAARIATNIWPAALPRVVAVRSNDPACVNQALSDARALLSQQEDRVLSPICSRRNHELTLRYGASNPKLDALADALDAIHYFAAEVEPALAGVATIVCEDYWSSQLDRLRQAELDVTAERMMENLPAPRLIVSLSPDDQELCRFPAEVEVIRLPSASALRHCLVRELRVRGLRA
jgi:hypothetical protein